MADIAKLVYEVDSRQVKRAEQDLNSFAGTNQQAQQAMYGTSSASQAASSSYKSAGGAARSANAAIKGTATAGGGAITSLRTLAATVKGLAVAYGGMKAASAVMDSLHRQADMGDLAQQLGTTTEYISSMGYAAERTGSSADHFSDGLEKMTRRLGQVAQDGGGPAAKALKNVGLSIEDVQQMNPQQQFEAIAEGIRGMGSASEQSAAAQKFFGRQNVDLVNTINAGNSALEGFQDEAAATGAVIRGDMAEGADEAIQGLNNLWSSVQTIVDIVATAFAPAITEVANLLSGGLNDALSSSSDSMKVWQDVISKAVGLVANRVMAGVNTMKTAINGVTTAIMTAYNATSKVLEGDLSGAIGEVKSGFSDQIENIKQFGEEQYKRMGWSFGEAENEGIAEAREKQPEVKAQLPDQSGGSAIQAPRSPSTPARSNAGRQASTGKSAEQREKERQAREAREEEKRQIQELQQSLNGLRSTQEQATDERMEQLNNIKEAQNRGMISEKRAAELTTRVWDQWGDQVEEATEGASTFATRAAENIQDQLGDTLEQTLQGNFDGILSSWASMLQKMIAEAASQKLGEALFGDFGSGSGSIGGLLGSLGGMFGGGGSSRGGTATDLITGMLPGFASGGFTGRGRKNDIAGLVHGNEMVMDANTTKKYAPELNAMNDGSFGGEVKKSSGGNFAPSINVNYNESEGGSGSNDKQSDRDKFLDQMEGRLRQMWKKWNQEDVEQGGPVSKTYRNQFGLRRNNRVA